MLPELNGRSPVGLTAWVACGQDDAYDGCGLSGASGSGQRTDHGVLDGMGMRLSPPFSATRRRRRKG